jgi:hypothetical protein
MQRHNWACLADLTSQKPPPIGEPRQEDAPKLRVLEADRRASALQDGEAASKLRAACLTRTDGVEQSIELAARGDAPIRRSSSASTRASSISRARRSSGTTDSASRMSRTATLQPRRVGGADSIRMDSPYARDRGRLRVLLPQGSKTEELFDRAEQTRVIVSLIGD